MVKNIMESTSIQRLQGILQSRYGTGLRVEFMSDVSLMDSGSQAPSFVEGALRIPIFSEGQFLAKAVLPDASAIGHSDYETISDLVRMVLEPLMSKWLVHQPLVNRTVLKENENVIPMFRIYNSNEESTELTQDDISVRSFQTSAIYLQTRNPLLIHKVASTIHEISGRWASVPFEQVQSEIESILDIQDLGAMTLIVNDLLNLTPEKRALLADYLANEPSQDMPLLVVSSSTPLNELVDQEVVTKEFAVQMQKCVLEVDRLPLKLEDLKQTLELFLEPGTIL